MSTYIQTLTYFSKLPYHIQWRTFLVQLPRFVPLSILHLTSRKGPQPFIVALPSRKAHTIPLYIFVPPHPVDLGDDEDGEPQNDNVDTDTWKVPIVLDFHGGGFIMGSPLEQAPYAAMMSRELGAVVISVSYRIGPFNQFPSAIHDGEDVLAAILDTDGITKAGKILRTELQRYYSLMRESSQLKKRKRDRLKAKAAHPHSKPASPAFTFNMKSKIALDTTRLCISGFSAGGNLALNLAISVPAPSGLPPVPPEITDQTATGPGPQSPLLPPPRVETVLDDPEDAWPNVLPPSHAQPRLIPLLLFYPSLDARLLPHERPRKPLPNALHPEDQARDGEGKPEKPKVPGLFSIMSPTYLPKKLRAHPRASPGLMNPKTDIQKNAAIFLVLSEHDTLAVQSDVWVNKMNEAGWTGPVRFGDARDLDQRDHVEHVSRVRAKENGGLEVWHAPGCRHGWTQFPEKILKKHEKEERKKVFERTLEFVKENWRCKLGV